MASPTRITINTNIKFSRRWPAILKQLKDGVIVEGVSAEEARLLASNLLIEARRYMGQDAPNRVKPRTGRYKTGKMWNSWHKQIVKTQRGYKIRIWNTKDYWKYQEYGTKHIEPALSLRHAARVVANATKTKAAKQFAKKLFNRIKIK